MMSAKRHIVLIGSTCATIALLGFFGYRAYALKRTPDSLVRAKANYPGARREWMAQTFVGARAPEVASALSAKLQDGASGKELLKASSIQLKEAEHALQMVIIGLSSVDFDEYMRFRLPVATYTAREDMLRWTRSHLEKHTAIGKVRRHGHVRSHFPFILGRGYIRRQGIP